MQNGGGGRGGEQEKKEEEQREDVETKRRWRLKECIIEFLDE